MAQSAPRASNVPGIFACRMNLRSMCGCTWPPAWYVGNSRRGKPDRQVLNLGDRMLAAPAISSRPLFAFPPSCPGKDRLA